MKAKEFIFETYKEYKTKNVNVSATVEPGRGWLNQNISNIRYSNEEANIYSIFRQLAKDGVPEDKIQQLMEDVRLLQETETDKANQLLLELTEAYYTTAYAVLAQSAEDLLAAVNAKAAALQQGAAGDIS